VVPFQHVDLFGIRVLVADEQDARDLISVCFRIVLRKSSRLDQPGHRALSCGSLTRNKMAVVPHDSNSAITNLKSPGRSWQAA